MAKDRNGNQGPDTSSDEIVEVLDERTPLAQQGLELIERVFPPYDRQPVDQIGMEIAEKRMGLLTSYDFHLFVARGDDGEARATNRWKS